MVGQFQGTKEGKVISVPATEHWAIQAANTSMLGATDAAGNLGLLREAYGDAFRVTFAKKPRLIPKNLEILEAEGPGGQSAGEGDKGRP